MIIFLDKLYGLTNFLNLFKKISKVYLIVKSKYLSHFSFLILVSVKCGLVVFGFGVCVRVKSESELKNCKPELIKPEFDASLF